MTEFTEDEEFKNLEKYGFISEYISIKDKHISPAFKAEDMLVQGFLPKGTKVRFTGQNGTDWDQKRIQEQIDVGHVLTVKSCSIGRFSSDYEFKEINGKHNTVMFEKVKES